MTFSADHLHRGALALAALIITVPGVRMLFDPVGYAEGKDDLVLTADLCNELRAMGSLFIAAGGVLLAGALVDRFRSPSSLVGVIAFLPQGFGRLVSFVVDEGPDDSYLRAGIIEVVVGVALAALLFRFSRARVTA